MNRLSVVALTAFMLSFPACMSSPPPTGNPCGKATVDGSGYRGVIVGGDPHFCSLTFGIPHNEPPICRGIKVMKDTPRVVPLWAGPEWERGGWTIAGHQYDLPSTNTSVTVVGDGAIPPSEWFRATDEGIAYVCNQRY
jgi:hypothetical protein